MLASLAAAAEKVRATVFESLRHAADKFLQVAVLLAGLLLTIRMEVSHTRLEFSEQRRGTASLTIPDQRASAAETKV